MDNTEKLLIALIDALGYDIKKIDVNPMRHDRYPSTPIYDYKLSKKVDLPKPIHDKGLDALVESFK